MSLASRASARHLRHHPGQLALCVLGVALGVAVVVSIDLAVQSAKQAFRISAETVSGRATHQVVPGPGGLPDSTFAAIRVGLGLRESAPVVEGYGRSDALPGVTLRLLGVDPFSEFPFRPFAAGGASGIDVGTLMTTPGGVILLDETAELAGVAIGDTLVVRTSGSPGTLRVAGTVSTDDPLTASGLRDVLLMDVSGAQEVLGRPGRLDRIDLIIPDDESGTALLEAIAARIPGSARVESTGTRTDSMAGMIASFDLNLRALSLLAMVFGMFLIYNALNFSILQRRELLGRLRTLGVTRSEIFGYVLREAAGIAVVGVAFGLLLGSILGRGLVRLVTRTINDLYFVVSVQGIEIDPLVLLKGAILGVGTTVLASIPAARAAASAPPRLAQTRSTVEEDTRRLVPIAAGVGVGLAVLGTAFLFIPSQSILLSFSGLFLIILGMALMVPFGLLIGLGLARPLIQAVGGILGVLASRSVIASLSRTAPAVAALVVAVSVTVGLGIMIQSFRSTLVRWLDGTLQADVYVSLPSSVASRAEGTLPPDLILSFADHPDVDGISTYRGNAASAPWGEAAIIALDLDPRGEDAFEFLDGNAEDAIRSFREDGAILVSEPMAYRHGLSVGSAVDLRTEDGVMAFPVAGVFYDYGSDRGVVMMSRVTFDRHWTDPGVTSLGLFVRGGADVEAVTRSLQASVSSDDLLLSVRSNRVLRESSLEVFDRTFQVTAVLRLLAFMVAFIGVLGALMALQLERARELGVLRATGLTPGQVWRLVTTQTGLMGLASGLLAIPMGVVLAIVMIFVVNRRSFGWTLRMEIGAEVVTQAVLLALAGALIAGLYPAWKMSRTPPALALRSE